LSDALALLSAVEQAALVDERRVSPAELVQASLDRIERLEPTLNAFVMVRAEEALAEARSAERCSGAPFRGVPIAIKDLTATAGIQTTYSSRAFADHIPAFDAAVVRRIREAGFLILGKTNTSEFGTTPFTESELNGATRNPWDTTLTPGGSSGGAAVAVAAGMLPVAHGSDGGGSIRIPASCCGLFGLKPSRGRVSAAPFMSLEGLGTAGPLARTVTDAAALLDVLSGYEPGDPWWAPTPERPFREEASRDPGRLRALVVTEPALEADVDPECAAAAIAAGELLESLGHEVEEGVLPWRLPELLATFLLVWQLGPALFDVADRSLLTPLNRALAERAAGTTSTEYGLAVVRLHAFAREVVARLAGVDVLVTPTLALPPVRIGWQEEEPDPLAQLARGARFTPFTAIANLTGLPAASLPLAWSSAGLPLGVQLVGPPAGEALLIRLSAQLEAASPWRDRRPPELPETNGDVRAG
jgi:amidase